MTKRVVFGSFRDPSGVVFFGDGFCFRQVNLSYKENYDCFRKSGLSDGLSAAESILPYQEADIAHALSGDAYRVLRTENLPFISYPYEWSFSQLKDAALATLKIQKTALGHGMSLKDASVYNIQFYKGKPVLIDTLSFEKYRKGEPWIAYGQFCRHFLAPLALMSYKDARLGRLLVDFIDGIPLDLASSLLPSKTYFDPWLATHIHLHSRWQKKTVSMDTRSSKAGSRKMQFNSLCGLIDSLESCVKNLTWDFSEGSEWMEYYSKTGLLSREYRERKARLVEKYLDDLSPRSVWDLGANTGAFSRIASGKGIPTVSFDVDPACVEINYRQAVEKKEETILPLLLDLNNPSPGSGWENRERMSLLERGPVDAVLMLAIVHHLAISNNLPLQKIADFLHKICRFLIVEFVPKNDPMVKKLLAWREDIFDKYTQKEFENAFATFFETVRSDTVNASGRIMYLMKRKSDCA